MMTSKTGFWMAATLSLVVTPSLWAKKKQPNILYIMSDDHAAHAIGAYGSRLATLDPTPTLDRIASEGIVMTNVFATNSISTPSRACITSGQYAHQSKVYDLDDELPVAKQNLPRELRKLGYETAIIGKWHLHTEPAAFDYYNIFYGQGQYFDPILWEKGTTDSLQYAYRGKRGLMPGKRMKGHSSDVVTDATLNWLENKRDESKPFFLMHHFKAPHDNFEYNPRYNDYLANVYIPEPASLWNNQNNGSVATRGWEDSLTDTIGSSVGRRNQVHDMGSILKVNPRLSDAEYKSEAYQTYLKAYLRCVKGVDDNIKRILDYLEAEGILDETIIIYTADQGFMLGEHDYIDKRWMYEESMRMPFIVRYPKEIKPGQKSNAIINNVDFAPTLLDLAGAKKPAYMQGDSFKEILYTGEEPQDWKQATYYRYWMHMIHHFNPAHFGIRTKDYKLIFFYARDYRDRPKTNQYRMSGVHTPVAWELYDLRKDPQELNNCYADPAYAEVVKDLKAQLKQMREDIGEDDRQFPKIQQQINRYWNK